MHFLDVLLTELDLDREQARASVIFQGGDPILASAHRLVLHWHWSSASQRVGPGT